MKTIRSGQRPPINHPYVVVDLVPFHDPRGPQRPAYTHVYDDIDEACSKFLGLQQWAREHGYEFRWSKSTGNPIADSLSRFD